MKRWSIFVVALVCKAAFSGPLYEWCDPSTGRLRAGDQPPSGVDFWLETQRPAPVLKNGVVQPLCAPALAPSPTQVTVMPSQSTDAAAEQERQRRSIEVANSLTRQTREYQEGSLAHHGEQPDEKAISYRSSSPLILHRGFRSRLDEVNSHDSENDADKTVHVRAYTRKDGTQVDAYDRSPPSR